jgi:hypothetical protein
MSDINTKLIADAQIAGFRYSLGKLVIVDRMNRQVDVTGPLLRLLEIREVKFNNSLMLLQNVCNMVDNPRIASLLDEAIAKAQS